MFQLKMKFFIGSLIAFGSLFFVIGLAGFIGVYDDLITNFYTQFGDQAVAAFTSTHSAEDALNFSESVSYWLGLMYMTRQMVFFMAFFMAFICWTDAWESYDVSYFH